MLASETLFTHISFLNDLNLLIEDKYISASIESKILSPNKKFKSKLFNFLTPYDNL